MTQELDTVVSTNTNTNTEVITEPITEPGTKPEVVVETKKEVMIPKERFDEVNGKYKDLATQMEDMKKAKADMEKVLSDIQTANEVNKSTIAETTSKLEKQVQSYESIMNEMVATKLQTIPEDLHELIPEGLSLEQKLSWINKAESKGLLKKQPQVVVGQALNHSSDQDKAERIKKMNPLQALASYYSQAK